MDKPMPNVAFNMMSLMFKAVDVVRPSDALLDEIGIKAGYTVLDFGCGPGRYEPSLSGQVGPSGTVCVDVALLFDIFHMLSEPLKVLAELHRVLKPSGLLACSIDHMSEEEALEHIVATCLFELSGRGRKVLNFTKR